MLLHWSETSYFTCAKPLLKLRRWCISVYKCHNCAAEFDIERYIDVSTGSIGLVLTTATGVVIRSMLSKQVPRNELSEFECICAFRCIDYFGFCDRFRSRLFGAGIVWIDCATDGLTCLQYSIRIDFGCLPRLCFHLCQRSFTRFSCSSPVSIFFSKAKKKKKKLQKKQKNCWNCSKTALELLWNC